MGEPTDQEEQQLLGSFRSGGPFRRHPEVHQPLAEGCVAPTMALDLFFTGEPGLPEGLLAGKVISGIVDEGGKTVFREVLRGSLYQPPRE